MGLPWFRLLPAAATTVTPRFTANRMASDWLRVSVWLLNDRLITWAPAATAARTPRAVRP